MTKFDSILFDLDGTLWDSSVQIAAAWNEIIETVGHDLAMAPAYRGRPLSAADVRGVCGLTMDTIADRLFGDYADKHALAERCFDYENEYLADHHGVVYPAMAETLAALAPKVPLFVVSNCQCGYIEVFLRTSGLEPLFTDHLSFGDTGRPKGENIRAVCEKHGLRAPVYVGDTQGDADAAALAGVPFVHAAYGFGTVRACVGSIHSPQELLAFV